MGVVEQYGGVRVKENRFVCVCDVGVDGDVCAYVCVDGYECKLDCVIQ